MNKINGLKVAILGDSISTANGGGPGIPEPQTYGGLLRDLDGCIIYRDAIAGSKLAGGFTTNSRWQSLNSLFTPDVILVFGGINDFLQDVPLGTITDTTTSTFYGGLDYLCKSLLNRYQTSRIFFMTPLHTTYTLTGIIPEYNGQNFLTEFVEAEEKVCKRYGISVINTNQDSGINCQNVDELASDLIHVGVNGHQRIHDTIISETNFKLRNAPTPVVVESVVFDIKSNGVGNISYDSNTNVLNEQVLSSAVNYEYALTDDCVSAVITMPTNSPVALHAVCVGSDDLDNAIVLYLDGTGLIRQFSKTGTVSSGVNLYTIPDNRPNIAKGNPVTITHGATSFNVSYLGYSKDIDYSLVPALTVKSIGVLCTGANVNTYVFDKIS